MPIGNLNLKTFETSELEELHGNRVFSSTDLQAIVYLSYGVVRVKVVVS